MASQPQARQLEVDHIVTDQAWAENGRSIGAGGLADRWLLLGLAFFVIVAFAGFFVFSSGKSNNFPTYFTGLFTLAYLACHPHVLGWLLKSRIFLVGLCFAAYLSITALWSNNVVAEELVSTFGGLALLITMLFAIVICAREFSGFLDLLISLIIVSATASAVHFFLSDSAHPWGRLSTPTVACLVYGLGTVLAVCRLIIIPSWPERSLWAVCGVILLGACYKLGVAYVHFGMLTAAAVLCALYAWRHQSSRRFYVLAPLLVILIIVQLVSFNDVLEANRAVIWAPVVDMIYNFNPIFGSGLLTEASPGLACSAAEDVPIESSDCLIEHPHNVYVATMYFGGVVGLGLLLLLVLVALAYTIEAPAEKHKPLILASLAYAFSVLMFDGDRLVEKLDFLWLVFWLPIALAIVLNLRARDLEEGEEP